MKNRRITKVIAVHPEETMNIWTNFDGNPFNSLTKKHTNEPHGDGRESQGVNNTIRIHSLGTADTAMPRAIPLAIA